jgi:hypothetical protein
VSSQHQRDQTTDALLSAALPGLPGQRAAGCLDAETLAAWADRTLPPTDAERAEAHLASCDRCQHMLAAFVRSEPLAPAAAAVPFWQRWGRRWLVPAGAVAAAVLVVIVATRESAPPPEVQVARYEAPSASSPSEGAGPSASRAAAPVGALTDRIAPASPPLQADAAQAKSSPVANTLELRQDASAPARAAEAGRLETRERPLSGGTVTKPGVAGGLAAPPPPTPAAGAPAADPRDAQGGAAPAAPAPETPRPQRAEATVQERKTESVRVTNLPADDAGRFRQSPVVVVPGELQREADAAGASRAVTLAKADAGTVVAEIVSEPRPAFGRTGSGAGRGGRGPAAATEAAQAASTASKLPNTIPARWRILADGRVERSTNSGATWHPVAIDVPVPLVAGSSPSDLVAWFVGPRGAVLLATDGERLNRIPFPNTSDLVAITAVNDRAATIRTADGRTFVTGDGGKSWVER